MKLLVFHATLIVLLIVPVVFIANKVYEDGIIGRFFLGCISLSAFMFILDWLDEEGASFDPPLLAVVMVSAFAGFLVWHLWRFHRRVLKRDAAEKQSAACPNDRRVIPDRRFCR